MIIAGEASGDMHGAHLVKDLKQNLPHLTLKGMGGNAMRHEGVSLLADITEFSVCGFVEIIRYLPKFYTLFQKIKKELINHPPDLLILIDYPSFNLRLAKLAQKLKIKVLYYISPQIWAWHTSRIKKIKRSVNMMAVIFPFESEFYNKHNVPVKYVGHPLTGKVKLKNTPSSTRKIYGIEDDKIVVGLLPGSRDNEIKYILPTVLETAKLLQKERPDLQFILPLANTLSETVLEPHLTDAKLNLKVVTEDRYDAMSICDAVVAASGTVTLELALLNIPMVLVYKGNFISSAIAKRVVKIPMIGLCNIIAGKKVAEELLLDQATPSNIAQEITKLLDQQTYRDEQKRNLAEVSSKLTAQKECGLPELVVDVLHGNL